MSNRQPPQDNGEPAVAASAQIADDELVIFIGHSGDAKPPALQLHNSIQLYVQQKLMDFDVAAKGTVHFRRVRVFEWGLDLPAFVEGQAAIDRIIDRAHVGVFVFQDRVGRVTREELERCRGRRIDVIAVFSKTPSFANAEFKFTDPSEFGRFQQLTKDWGDLLEFKQRLSQNWSVEDSTAIRPQEDFESPADLDRIVRSQLDLLLPHLCGKGPKSVTDSRSRPEPAADPNKYLRALLEASSFIDIRGLAVGSGKAHRFPIEELYIALRSRQGVRRSDDTAKSTTKESGEPGGVSPRNLESEIGGLGEVPLQAALAERRLVVIGDPGAGKTTFLRRIAAALCETELRIDANAAKSRLGIKDKTFPIFLRCATLANHIAAHCGKAGAPTDVASPAWLPHCLAAQSRESGTGLDQAFVQRQLEAGSCTVLLDGLDEAPDRVQRDGLSQLAENLSRTFSGCRFVVTSRPPA